MSQLCHLLCANFPGTAFTNSLSSGSFSFSVFLLTPLHSGDLASSGMASTCLLLTSRLHFFLRAAGSSSGQHFLCPCLQSLPLDLTIPWLPPHGLPLSYLVSVCLVHHLSSLPALVPLHHACSTKAWPWD